MAQTPPPDDFDAQVAELERYLDALDQKTFSNFKVTNPVSGVSNLEVGPAPDGYQVRLRDDNGNVIFGNDTVRDWGLTGLRIPMPMYPSKPIAGLQAVGTGTTWVNGWQMKTFINTARLQIAYRFADVAPAGGTSEYRVSIDTGSGAVVMPGSLWSTVNPPASVFGFFGYQTPSNLFATEVDIFFQSRMASGTGSAMISPFAILGG